MLPFIEHSINILLFCRYLTARHIHPNARKMAVMRRWTIVFHLYGDYVIVDRILASKNITE